MSMVLSSGTVVSSTSRRVCVTSIGCMPPSPPYPAWRPSRSLSVRSRGEAASFDNSLASDIACNDQNICIRTNQIQLSKYTCH